MRIGLIGLGRIGAFHATTLSNLDRVSTLLVTDVVPGVAEATAARIGATPVEAVEDMFDAGLDAVVIASSTPSHLGLLRTAVQTGVPAFCEKPVAEDPYAAKDLAAFVERHQVPVQIGFPRRFDPAFLAAKAEFDRGALGWLTTIRSTTMDASPPSAAYIATSGGIFRDCSVHDIDTLRWVTGREVVEVYAVGGNRGAAFFGEAGDVDTASVLLTLDDGTIGLVSNTRYNGEGYDVRLELHGSKGAIAAGLDEGLPIRSASPDVRFPAGPRHRDFMGRLAEAFRRELATFLEVAAKHLPSPCTVADGLEASWVAEACTRSSREHRPVTLSEIR
jgi:myo-inositol 2-dehydrogenase / D-chiro-inositol 1-dehydrogenase